MEFGGCARGGGEDFEEFDGIELNRMGWVGWERNMEGKEGIKKKRAKPLTHSLVHLSLNPSLPPKIPYSTLKSQPHSAHTHLSTCHMPTHNLYYYLTLLSLIYLVPSYNLRPTVNNPPHQILTTLHIMSYISEPPCPATWLARSPRRRNINPATYLRSFHY
jgi:hypothetical protein